MNFSSTVSTIFSQGLEDDLVFVELAELFFVRPQCVGDGILGAFKFIRQNVPWMLRYVELHCSLEVHVIVDM
jgi:hypothetical protein